MDVSRDLLERIASALDRLAPPDASATDWTAHPAYLFDERGIRGLERFDSLPLETLRGIDKQKSAVTENLLRLSQGVASHDMLLWGARGMGKSALIRASVARVQSDGPGALALVQVAPGAIREIAGLVAALHDHKRSFVIFIDDLGFGEGETQTQFALRSLLDGGIMARGTNIRLAVTSNRRAILSRGEDEVEALHAGEERDNALALADRFGLKLGFHPCNQATYLDMVRAYTDPADLSFDETEALAWAIARGNRSGRTAYQYACEIAGRAGRGDPAAAR
ncbi:DUF815 domain-containing protein [Qipengyuania nanhaisediminis]|uniref:DUF815 domain-containing protein n=1 Tax=Qipengyuania nanhaisediminis TaxID=604088 RepID=UPI0038B3A99F